MIASRKAIAVMGAAEVKAHRYSIDLARRPPIASF
jgi:hypothetical protein